MEYRENRFHRFLDGLYSRFSIVFMYVMSGVLGIWVLNFWLTGTGTVDDSPVVFVLGYILILSVFIWFPILVFMMIEMIVSAIIDLIKNFIRKRKGK